jgi:hypothetical protein
MSVLALKKENVWRLLMDSNRRVLVKGLGVVLLEFIPFLSSCNRLSGDIQPKEEKMQIRPGAQTPSVPRKSIPPMDLAAPSRIEAATFALG